MWLALLILCIFLVPLVFSILRSNELAALEYQRGELRLARGRLPHALFNELEDVLVRSAAQRASVRLILESQRARLLADGVDEATEQRLRNVAGRFPTATIRTGLMRPNPRRRA